MPNNDLSANMSADILDRHRRSPRDIRVNLPATTGANVGVSIGAKCWRRIKVDARVLGRSVKCLAWGGIFFRGAMSTRRPLGVVGESKKFFCRPAVESASDFFLSGRDLCGKKNAIDLGTCCFILLVLQRRSLRLKVDVDVRATTEYRRRFWCNVVVAGGVESEGRARARSVEVHIETSLEATLAAASIVCAS
jgi:hypothetical protein